MLCPFHVGGDRLWNPEAVMAAACHNQEAPTSVPCPFVNISICLTKPSDAQTQGTAKIGDEVAHHRDRAPKTHRGPCQRLAPCYGFAAFDRRPNIKSKEGPAWRPINGECEYAPARDRLQAADEESAPGRQADVGPRGWNIPAGSLFLLTRRNNHDGRQDQARFSRPRPRRR